MRKRNLNSVNIEGYVFEVDEKMKVCTAGANAKHPGSKYIKGKMSIATDEECLNVIPVNFVYVAPTYANGNENATFGVLSQIIENKNTKTVVSGGKENAYKVNINASIDLLDFIDDRATTPELERVSRVRCNGSFVRFVSKLAEPSERNKFETDMLIVHTGLVEANPDRHIDEDFLQVSGYIFNYRNEFLPITFSVHNENGMKFFEKLDLSEGRKNFRKVWGHIINQTVKTSYTEESAFGEPVVTVRERTNRDYVISGTSLNEYDFGDENVMTEEDVTKGLADREVHWATVKKDHEDYLASKNTVDNAFAAAAKSTPTTTVNNGGFSF